MKEDTYRSNEVVMCQEIKQDVPWHAMPCAITLCILSRHSNELFIS